VLRGVYGQLASASPEVFFGKRETEKSDSYSIAFVRHPPSPSPTSLTAFKDIMGNCCLVGQRQVLASLQRVCPSVRLRYPPESCQVQSKTDHPFFSSLLAALSHIQLLGTSAREPPLVGPNCYHHSTGTTRGLTNGTAVTRNGGNYCSNFSSSPIFT